MVLIFNIKFQVRRSEPIFIQIKQEIFKLNHITHLYEMFINEKLNYYRIP
jgi:hypothetical protein